MKNVRHFATTLQGQFIIALAVCVIALLGYYAYAMKNQANTPQEVVTVSETDHVRGAAGAKVTLVEFGDFQCPACGAYEPIVQQVLADNKDTVQIVFKHFPLVQIHQNALLAAKASEAAAVQGKFWEMHDMLYAKQQDWSGALNARDMMIGYATELSLDATQFANDMARKDIEEKIVAEFKEGARLGVQGTPTFFLNGTMIKNPGSVEAFNEVIKNALQ